MVHLLWLRYQERLARLASRKLGDLPRRAADENDVMYSAFNDVLRGVEEGRFAPLDDRDDLWQVLVMLTERRAIDLRRHQQADKRGGGQVRDKSVPETDFAPSSAAPGIGQLASNEPMPQFAAQVQVEFVRLYSARYEAIRHGGHNTMFVDASGQWWSTLCGWPHAERAAVLAVHFDVAGRLLPGRK